jgi:hypothetical protein
MTENMTLCKNCNHQISENFLFKLNIRKGDFLACDVSYLNRQDTEGYCFLEYICVLKLSKNINFLFYKNDTIQNFYLFLINGYTIF